ncbi:hypothetical protein [Actinophytocola sp.]|uniref:hypothetical protein n=1 Tax=Actinophytocola sp. TaxID=1872138 RepID=UPI002ED0951B
MFKSFLAKGLTVKAAIILAATGTTGVALAAGSGALSVPWGESPATPPANSRAATPSAPPSVTPTGRPSDVGKPADAGTPSPSMAGLCQAYESQVRENPGKALESAAFTALVDAAGGADKVPQYCDTLPDEHPTGKPSDLPTPTTYGSEPASRPAPPSHPETPGSSVRAAVPSGPKQN